MARPKKHKLGIQLCVTLNKEYIQMFAEIPEDQDLISGRPKYGRRNEHIEHALDAYFSNRYPELWDKIRKVKGQ